MHDTVLRFQSFPVGFLCVCGGGHSSPSPSPLSGLQSSCLLYTISPEAKVPSELSKLGTGDLYMCSILRKIPLRLWGPGKGCYLLEKYSGGTGTA